MVLSAPSMIFSPTKLSIGEIDVGSSSAKATYHVMHSVIKSSCSMANMKNMSISFQGSTNASEAKTESWLWLSTSTESGYVCSIGLGGAKECRAPSVAQDNSIRVAYKVKVASDATTAGTVLFKHHHRYQKDLAYIC